MRRARLALAFLLVGGLAGAASLPALRAFWWWRESNPVRRGAAIAARAGCLSCHGPNGTQGLPDPALGEEVPTWDGGVPMMYVRDLAEAREYVLDGVSRRRAASTEASEKRRRAAVRMPAYRDVLRPREVDDVLAYFGAAARMDSIPDDSAARGRALVAKHRCEACHGLAGAGGVLNPGSLKGYVPGWRGGDFLELARDDAELREWIRDGRIGRFAGDRLARFFLDRQRLQMPAYAAALAPSDLDDIAAYIRWLRLTGRP